MKFPLPLLRVPKVPTTQRKPYTKIIGVPQKERQFYTICNIMRTLKQHMYKPQAERI